jgi:hypothetical protein
MEEPMSVGDVKQREMLKDDELVFPGLEDKSSTSSTRSSSVRLNLVLPDKSASRLERLKKITEASSFAEVIRNAIRIYEALVMEYEKGNKVQIVDKDGHPVGVSIF